MPPLMVMKITCQLGGHRISVPQLGYSMAALSHHKLAGGNLMLIRGTGSLVTAFTIHNAFPHRAMLRKEVMSDIANDASDAVIPACAMRVVLCRPMRPERSFKRV